MERKITHKVRRSPRQSEVDINGCMDNGEGAILAIKLLYNGKGYSNQNLFTDHTYYMCS